MNSKIRFFEELAFNSHRALNTELYDGWVLRAANGYTNRANSVGLLYASTIQEDEKIAYCEEFYFKKKQNSVFKLTDGCELDAILEKKGYEYVTPTDCMLVDLNEYSYQTNKNADVNVMITSNLTEEWLQAFYQLESISDERTRKTALQMLQKVENDTLYCRIEKDGKAVACASAVIERGYMALLNVIVDETYRGKHFGELLCTSILQAAKERGAHTGYLQVVQGNAPAENLYYKLGYRKIYSYWYRVKAYKMVV